MPTHSWIALQPKPMQRAWCNCNNENGKCTPVAKPRKSSAWQPPHTTTADRDAARPSHGEPDKQEGKPRLATAGAIFVHVTAGPTTVIGSAPETRSQASPCTRLGCSGPASGSRNTIRFMRPQGRHPVWCRWEARHTQSPGDIPEVGNMPSRFVLVELWSCVSVLALSATALANCSSNRATALPCSTDHVRKLSVCTDLRREPSGLSAPRVAYGSPNRARATSAYSSLRGPGQDTVTAAWKSSSGPESVSAACGAGGTG